MGAATRLARSCASPIGSSSVRRLIELSRARADPSASSCACRAAPSALRCNSCCAASAAPTAWHACACARCCITLGSRCPICISRASSSSDACSSRCSCLSRSVSSASCLQHSSACAMEPSAALLLSCASLLARDRSTRGPRVLLSAKVENVPLKWVALCSMAASWASGPGGGASSCSSSSVYSTNSASSARKPSPSSAKRASSSACSSLAACHASSASASASRASSSSASSMATPRPEGTAPGGNAAAMETLFLGGNKRTWGVHSERREQEHERAAQGRSRASEVLSSRPPTFSCQTGTRGPSKGLRMRSGRYALNMKKS